MNKSVKIVNILEKLRPLDNVFLRELFRDYPPFTEYIVKSVTDIGDLKITEQICDTADRDVCLEAIGRNCAGVGYRFIILSDNLGGEFSIDSYTPVLAADDKDLNTYAVFFDETDISGENKPVYDLGFSDGKTHIIRVNCAYENNDDNSLIAKLIRDFNRSNPDEMELPLLCLRVGDYKFSPDGIVRMRNALIKMHEYDVKK